jgi:Ca-activated chloride channel family protein
MPAPIATISVDAAWERSALRLGRDETGLLITIAANRRETDPGDRAPLDIAFALDRSGSMGGAPIGLAKEAAFAATRHLGPRDRVALVAFDHEIEVVQPLAAVTGPMRDAFREHLERIDARGSTDLSSGWLTACHYLAHDAPARPGSRLQRAILLTDGQANQGITDPGALATHAAALWARGISTTAMGLGHHFDEVLLSSIAEAGGGNFQYIDDPRRFAAFFEAEIGGLTGLVALQPRLQITMPRGLRAHLLNRYPTHRTGKTITVNLRDLVAGDRIELAFVVTHRGNLDETSAHVRATLVATDPDTAAHRAEAVAIAPLRFVPDAEAERAPVDQTVSVVRAQEEARRDEWEALQLDRAGQHTASRAAFARSRDRLADADARAAAAGYAGVEASRIESLRTEIAESRELAQAPAAMLGEDVHKRRTASTVNRSRGGPRQDET